jgi:2,5-diamino-6-(ribosylamino)-4(3H)-pyrimidinone 5'-phosphate reductase
VIPILPEVIVHNSVSLDGSLTGFAANLPLHYRIAGGFHADMHLVGSRTARMGMDQFLTAIPEETDADLRKPGRDGILWAIPDTSGTLQGLLHVFRQSGYCRDVVILVAETTPKDYLRYLEERDYDHFIAGEDKIDLRRALELLQETYGVKTILTDTGAILGNLLILQGLATRISLLVHPVIVGTGSYPVFSRIDRSLQLSLVKRQYYRGGYQWLVYSPAP